MSIYKYIYIYIFFIIIIIIIIIHTLIQSIYKYVYIIYWDISTFIGYKKKFILIFFFFSFKFPNGYYLILFYKFNIT